MTGQKQKKGLRRWWILFVIIGILAAIVIAVLTPWNISSLTSHPQPVKSYEEALERIDALRGQEASDMNPDCKLQFLTHEQKVEDTIILVHGYTNCPRQFVDLGKQYYDLGYNVLIAPLPYHGLADRMTDAHAQLKAEDLAVYADEVVDIAQGLGDRVVILGISAGGVTTAWAAQNRADIDLAVIISPAFGFKQIPTALTAAVMNAFTILPDEFVWWDPVLQADAPPTHAYPRYSKHALVQTLRLGFAVQQAAGRGQPAASKMVVVLNPTDESVNNELTRNIIQAWQKQNVSLTTYEFNPGLELVHDLIDPTQTKQKIVIVYPILIELTGK
ncbi:MAG: alpha/beta hydrolase [Anaerolineaceae bacterium]